LVKTLGIGFAAGAALVAVIAVALWMQMGSRPVSHVQIPVRAGTYLWGGHHSEARTGNRPRTTAFALLPDGRAIVYAATDGGRARLYLYRLEDGRTVAIDGTEGASTPFLSPTGDRVGFFRGRDICYVPIEGGEPRTVLADTVGASLGGYGAFWAGDDTILFGGVGIWRVRVTGVELEQLTVRQLDRREVFHLFPQLLPGGELLYTIRRNFFDWEVAEIVVQPEGGEPKVLITNGTDARYVPSGHLVFAREGALWAAGFDLGRLQLTSEPVRVLDGVMHGVGGVIGGDAIGAAQFSFSRSGSLAYAAGGPLVEPRQLPQ
jgi:serine/threonine-protein kinase